MPTTILSLAGGVGGAGVVVGGVSVGVVAGGAGSVQAPISSEANKIVTRVIIADSVNKFLFN
jgi:hypothetical protein